MDAVGSQRAEARPLMSWFNIFLIAVAALLTGAILLQQRGSGLSASFGGDGSSYHTKRGLEKIIFFATIALAILFIGVAFARLFLV